MFQNRSRILIMVLLVTVFLAAGCATKPAADTKAPEPSGIGIIDMSRAVKAHPKYSQLVNLQKQYAAMEAELAARAQVQPDASAAGLPEGAMAGMNAAFEQEFNAKMAAKQAEIKARLDAKAGQVRAELAGEFDAYADEVDKTYQPQIFNLQLKLKTVQLSKEEMDKLQQELKKLQDERAAKLAAQEKDMSARMKTIMDAESAKAEREMAAYAGELNTGYQKQLAARQAEMDVRAQTLNAPDTPSGTGAESQRQLALKLQEIKALEDFIVNDVRDKAAQIAAGKKLEAVLAKVQVNVTGVDITDAVIAEFKK